MDLRIPKPRLGHIAFWTPRFAECRRFFSEAIGMGELQDGAIPRRWVVFGTASFSFSLNEAAFEPDPPAWSKCPRDPERNSGWSPYFTVFVDDLAAVMARCEARGARLRSTEPFDLGVGFGRSIEVMDPDGRTFGLVQAPDATTEVLGLDGVAAYVNDFHAACAFYEDIVGLTRAHDLGSHGRVFFVGDSPSFLACAGKTGIGVQDASRPHATFTLRVRSIDALRARLGHAGIAMTPESPLEMGDGILWFSFRDPSGNIIEAAGPP